MSATSGIQSALERFAARVHEKVSVAVAGEPEEHLRAPFERFLADAAGALGWDVVSSGEVWLPGRLGRPDFGVHLNKLLAGYVKLKAPGTGADPRRFSGRNREQWKRFQNLPNLLYSDGNEWTLCRGGEVVEALRLRGDITLRGAQAVAPKDAGGLERLEAGCAVLAATHDERFVADFAGRVVRLEGGRIVDDRIVPAARPTLDAGLSAGGAAHRPATAEPRPGPSGEG